MKVSGVCSWYPTSKEPPTITLTRVSCSKAWSSSNIIIDSKIEISDKILYFNEPPFLSASRSPPALWCTLSAFWNFWKRTIVFYNHMWQALTSRFSRSTTKQIRWKQVWSRVSYDMPISGFFKCFPRIIKDVLVGDLVTCNQNRTLREQEVIMSGEMGERRYRVQKEE